MDIEIHRLTRDDELYRRYDGREKPQPCHLDLDLDLGNFGAEYNPEVGNAVPMAVHNGRELWYPIPCLTADAANALMDRVAPLADRIYVGSEIEWDDNNHVGRLDDDGLKAHEELTRLCEALFEPGALDASELVTE